MLHASITTFLSVVSLSFCVVRIFVEFGMIIAASVVASITFALLALPALLVVFGPNFIPRGTASIYRHAVALVWTLVIVAACGVGLYLFDVLCGEVRLCLHARFICSCLQEHLNMCISSATLTVALCVRLQCVQGPNGQPLFGSLGQE